MDEGPLSPWGPLGARAELGRGSQASFPGRWQVPQGEPFPEMAEAGQGSREEETGGFSCLQWAGHQSKQEIFHSHPHGADEETEAWGVRAERPSPLHAPRVLPASTAPGG